ncbi:hypothetical protein PA598K_01823 [Paenibacillus sp. 598K]|nr:hypothetical protein PA598K_01823 [Paenibacillus sp. 598K]
MLDGLISAESIVGQHGIGQQQRVMVVDQYSWDALLEDAGDIFGADMG